MFCLQTPQSCQAVLAVEQCQLAVDVREGIRQQIRCAEEVFAGHREEFRRVLGCVRVDGGFGVGVGVQLGVQCVIGTLHGIGPVLHAHVAVQRRQAIGAAFEHVQLVCQFVDHQVVTFPTAAGFNPGPGEDHRALLPGFTTAGVIPFMFDATGVAVALGAEEVVRVKDDFVKALVPVQVAQVQQWQLCLSCQQQLLDWPEFQVGQGGQVLVMQKQYGALAQMTLFAFVDAVENRQAPAYFGPVGGVDRVVFEGAPTAPGLEGPHACRLFGMTTPP